MSSDLEKWWSEAADNIRRVRGICRLTREEADAELKKTKRMPLSEDEISSLVRHIVDGDNAQVVDEPCPVWSEEYDMNPLLEEELLQLNRNAGEENAETASRLEELRNRLLNDDEDDEV